MKKFIIKTNQWYDNLPGIKRDLFFLIVVLGSLVLTEYLMFFRSFVWAFPIWAGILIFWRVGYVIIKWSDKYKNTK